MLKILLATVDYPPKRGGVARYLHAIKHTFPSQIEVLYWQQGAPKYLRLVWELYQASKAKDVIWLSHIFPVGTAALFLLVFRKKPYVVILHGLDFDLARRHPLRKLSAWLILTAAEKVVCNSAALAKEVKAFSKQEAMVVYPPLRDDLVHVSHLKEDYFTSGPVKLLTVARLVERKGHKKVLDALQKFPNMEYDIVGDGPERSTLEAMIAERGLHTRVHVHKDVSDEELPTFFEQADIFVMPTTKSKRDREGFGIVYLEAALFGLPIIATRQPGVDEAMIHKGNGLLIDDTQEALVAAIDQLASDPGGRERMGKAGREFVLHGFTREVQMRKLDLLVKGGPTSESSEETNV